jgi:hypothetical protein
MRSLLRGDNLVLLDVGIIPLGDDSFFIGTHAFRKGPKGKK